MKYSLYLLAVILLFSCASGSHVVTGTARFPIDPTLVKLYIEKPVYYEVIGMVEASSDAGWTAQGSQNYAIEELKKQAAKMGANGILLNATGTKSSTMVGGYGTGTIWAIPVEAKTVSGVAIFVSE